MRRPLAALVLGAVSLAGLVPAAGAAGAAELPKFPFFSRKPVLKLACEVVRTDAAVPAVSCSWSAPPTRAAADAARVTPFEFRLGRVGADGRTIVYTGAAATHLDTTVLPDHRYGYRVQALTAGGRHIASSRLVKVALPDPAPDRLRFGCSAERTAVDDRRAHPVVACKWSASGRPDFDHYRLLRLDLDEKGWRQVVYRGKDASFVDQKVRAGRHYKYLVQAVDHRGHIIGTSDVADVRVPPIVIVDQAPKPVDACRVTADAISDTAVAVDPACPQGAPAPNPIPESKPEPRPAPEAEPRPAPKPLPRPEPKPAPEPRPAPLPTPDRKPEPVPAPKPGPMPDPRPMPPVARIKLACAPPPFATTDPAPTRRTDATFAPGEAAVVCEWAAPADLRVAGFQLWRAERPEGNKQVVFESTDVTRYVDRTVASGHRYLYVVRALDSSGRVIAQSDGVSVSFPPSTTTTTGAAA